MWLVSTRSFHSPAPAIAVTMNETTSTKPARRVEKRATAIIGLVSQVSCGACRVSGFTQPSSVGTRTIEIAKSTITPTADPRPNARTATTWLVASDAMPSAVVPLAASSGANRCETVERNASLALVRRRSSP